MKTTRIVAAALGVVAAGCATTATMSDEQYEAKALAMMRAGFKASGQAKLDRLEQDDMQKMCSHYVGDKKMPKEVAEKLEKEQQARIKYPADGNYLGKWQDGEKIAQSGVGKQFSDNPEQPSGANCYACHQLTKQEVSFGTIGPSLYNFGKLRGFTPEMQRYAYSKVYNSQAFAACSNMPRFGQNGILTEQQIKDVVALLMDPKSPVNQ
jgi:sulfur-oxidizing protein SoxX